MRFGMSMVYHMSSKLRGGGLTGHHISSWRTVEAGVLALTSIHLSLCTHVAFTM